MINIPYHKQKTEWTCGPASMRMVLDSLGIKKSEKELIKLLDTNEIQGTLHKSFPELAEKFNLNYIVGRKNSTLEQLDNLQEQDYRIIVSYFIPEDNFHHYAVLKEVDPKKIHLLDPWFGENTEYSIDNFNRNWHDLLEKYDKDKKWFFGIKK